MAHRPLILVVDDDTAIRRSVQVALEAVGYAVATVAGGKTALAWLATTRPDLVVLDVSGSAPDGWDVLRRQRRKDRPGGPVPVVVLLDCAHDRRKAFETGANHYLLKPFGPDEVVVRVAALLPYPAEPPSSETECVWRSLDAESEAALAAEFDAA
jgi:DNA-binding response OmpR family regulator